MSTFGLFGEATPGLSDDSESNSDVEERNVKPLLKELDKLDEAKDDDLKESTSFNTIPNNSSVVYYPSQQHIRDPENISAQLMEKQRLAEISQIQHEIQVDRNRWQPLYSDEESEQNELVGKVRKKRKITSKFVHNNLGEGGSGFAKGEGWKRLKLRAETKVKNNPEKYSSIPKHKFPLRP